MTGGVLDVVIPTSPAEAVTAFGDGDGVTVLAGGTIVMPELTHGRLKPDKVLMLARSGLDTIERDGGTVTIGAACSVGGAPGAGRASRDRGASHVADGEIRAQATVGGNLCAGPGADAPRGDLQAPLIVLDARVRSIGKGGERTEPVEDFLAGGAGRTARCSTSPTTRRTARRPTLPSGGRTRTTTRSSAVAGAKVGRRAPHRRHRRRLRTAVRLASVEQSGAAEDALADVDPPDDALASAWYRKTVLPTLVVPRAQRSRLRRTADEADRQRRRA